jgi:fucose 4-O-acetylase-like acetyltransferase
MSKSTIATAEGGLRRTENVFREVDAAIPVGRVPVQAATSRDTAFDYLRAFITVLVVAHHSVIAYARISPDVAPRHPLHPWLAGIPIADSHRLVSFDLFALFNDTFFMSLMFLLSGLFVWPSLVRKGGARFLRDRLLRLGVPFVVAALLAPVAYDAAYRAVGSDAGTLAFWREWLSLGKWPTGPAWFILVLLGFDGITAALHRFAPALIENTARRAASGLRHPVACFAALIFVSAVVYLPLRVAFGPDSCVTVGPFSLQSSRALHYLVYFLAGVVVGASDVELGLFARRGGLARQWASWTVAALALFAANLAVLVALMPGSAALGLAPLTRQLISGITFVVCCGAISFAMVAIFRRFVNTRTPVLDSLSRNAYGIYLVHYGFVLWLQFALLPAPLPAPIKAAVVLTVALVASWATAAGLRRMPAVRRVI